MANRKIVLEFERINEVEEVLNEIGMDVRNAINIFLMKIINDQDVSFLFSKEQKTTIVPKEEINVEKHYRSPKVKRMTKSKAVALFKQEGINFDNYENVVFSSKNKTTDVYWSNPSFNHLKINWCLILNDNINNKLYLLEVAADSISEDVLIPRADQTNLIDLQIMYGDPTFTDMRSKYSFAKFVKKTISY
jgi:antitoxin component of RelBE/YafQ-DinJ toxin-antitoxin module